MSYNAILSDEEVTNDPPVFLSTKTPKKIRKNYLEFKAEVDRWYEEICPASLMTSSKLTLGPSALAFNSNVLNIAANNQVNSTFLFTS